MSRIVKCALIQAACSTPTEEPLEKIKREAIEKHLKLLDEAARKGAKILCMQEIFTGPYFCAEQSPRWYGMVEKIPDGHRSSDAGNGPEACHGDDRSDLRGRHQ